MVDTGSTDKTVEIAQKYNAKVNYFKWSNDFSAARNAALALNTTHWVLVIDADEELLTESFYPLLKAISRPHYRRYNIKIKNQMYENDKENLLIHEGLRLFQLLPQICFNGAIHEQVAPSLIKQRYAISALNNLYLYHYGYMKDIVFEKNKHDRALEYLLEETKNDPQNSFQWFNLANTYFCKKLWSECIDASEKSVDYLPKKLLI